MMSIIRIQEIYNHLCDEQSKKIFESKLLFSLNKNNPLPESIFPPFEQIDFDKELKDLLLSSDEIVIYGAGERGSVFTSIWKKGIVAFCDRDKKKQGTKFCGYEVIAPEDIAKFYKSATVVIAIEEQKAADEIMKFLSDQGFCDNQIVKCKELTRLANKKLRSLQYFDIPVPIKDAEEVFIDCGCYDFKSSLNFMEWCSGNYKRIVAFEPSPSQYPMCVENIKGYRDVTLYPYALWDQDMELRLVDNGAGTSGRVTDFTGENIVKIEAVRLDDVLDGKEATFIKMDIEGAELNALKGAEQTIRKYRPKLAICVYHKPEDILEIPDFILSIHDDYQLYIRHFSLDTSETVLYAI